MCFKKKSLPLQFGKGTPYPYGWSGVILVRLADGKPGNSEG